MTSKTWCTPVPLMVLSLESIKDFNPSKQTATLPLQAIISKLGQFNLLTMCYVYADHINNTCVKFYQFIFF